MTEYAKREDIIEALMCYFIPPIYTGEQVDQAKNLAESIMNGVPTIDIVHCKDCKRVKHTPVSSWKRPYICRIPSKGLGYCPDDGNGYCPYGE